MNREKRNRRLSLFGCLLCGFAVTFLASAEAQTTNPPPAWEYEFLQTSTPSDDYAYPHLRTCGGNLSVSFNASIINFPKSTEEEAVHCRWYFTAPPGHRIGISSANISYNFAGLQFVHWYAFSGHNASDIKNLIAYTELLGRSIEGTWLPGVNDNPILSNSNTMVIDYISFGNGPLEANWFFYSCGGTVSGRGSVRSPVFHFPEFIGVPLLLQCRWELIMEDDAHFASIDMDEVDVRDDCGIINVTTNGIMKTIFPQGSNDTDFNMNASDTEAVTNACNKYTRVSKSQDKKNGKDRAKRELFTTGNETEKSTNISHMFICSKNIVPTKLSNQRLFVSGSRTIVEYILPCLLPDIGFRFYFQSYPHYSRTLSQRQVAERPIYVTYAGLLIWTPIGTLLGVIIICFHMRRRGPPKAKKHVENLVLDSSEAGKCDVIVQVTSPNTPVIKSVIKSSLNKQNCTNKKNQLFISSTAHPSGSENFTKSDSQAKLLGEHPKKDKVKFSKHVKFKKPSLIR